MTEYQSVKYPNKENRLMAYAFVVYALISVGIAHYRYGSGVWLTRLSEYMLAAAVVWAAIEIVRYRYYVRVRRVSDGHLPLGSKGLFWRSDRDPDDARLI